MNPYPRDEEGYPVPSRGKEIVREHMETRFPGRRFSIYKTLRWLEHPLTGRNLHLNCYNEELRLAVEYYGRQHYEFVPDMHERWSAFKYQQYRDAVKQELCEENNVHLIIVNSMKVGLDEISDYIDGELKKISDKKVDPDEEIDSDEDVDPDEEIDSDEEVDPDEEIVSDTDPVN